MTTVFQKEVACAACGHRFVTEQVGSTNAFGSMDLDMRPPPMRRDTQPYDIQECPGCHFCAPEVESPPDGVDTAWVQSPGYRNVALDASTPELPRRFLAFASLAKFGNLEPANAWANLNAAWAFDDLGPAWDTRAAACRTAVEQIVHRLHGVGMTFSDNRETDQILCLDLLRRSGRFEEAEAAASELMASATSDILRSIATFQRRCAKGQDAGCHRVDEAVG